MEQTEPPERHQRPSDFLQNLLLVSLVSPLKIKKGKCNLSEAREYHLSAILLIFVTQFPAPVVLLFHMNTTTNPYNVCHSAHPPIPLNPLTSLSHALSLTLFSLSHALLSLTLTLPLPLSSFYSPSQKQARTQKKKQRKERWAPQEIQATLAGPATCLGVAKETTSEKSSLQTERTLYLTQHKNTPKKKN